MAELRATSAEAEFFGLRTIDPLFLRIVEPSESVFSRFSWLRLTPEEYAANEDLLVQLIVWESGFLRSWQGALWAWLRVSA